MKKKISYIMISFFLLLLSSCIGKRPLIFLNSDKAVFRTGIRNIVVCNIPDGYKRDDIRIIRGHGVGVIIPYSDSSIVYVSTETDDCPNNENIIQLRNIPSLWRMNYKLLSIVKKDGVSQKLRQTTFNEYDFCYSELLDYEMPEPLDLSGMDKNKKWRDISTKDICVGYIVYDTLLINDFDKCIETTIKKLSSKKVKCR